MGISPNKRIALNVAATYGRSLVALVCGLFGARWVLQALGAVDYGLWGVIGGLSAFISFLSGLLAHADARFLAVAEGWSQGRKVETLGGDGVRAWFWTVVVVHLALATGVCVLGWPLGEWIVEHGLTVPPERMSAAICVWRCVCFSAWLGLASVPWSALYVAKQEIAEQTLYGFAATVANTAFFGWMAMHPGDWLERYAVWMMVASVLPQLFLIVRAHVKWPEIRYAGAAGEPSWCKDFGERLGKLAGFVGWRLFGSISGLLSNQGSAIAVNRWLGPVANAALTVGNAAAQQSMSLGSALSGALAPAVANAYGTGNLSEVRRLALVASRLGSFLVLIFTVPLMLEIDTVMALWLVRVPQGAEFLCICALAAGVLEKLVEGHWLSILAIGKIRGYQIACLFCGLTAFGLVVAGLGLGWSGIGIVGVAFVLDKALALVIRLWFGRRLVGLGIGNWMKVVLLPCGITMFVAVSLGLFPRIFGMASGFGRVVLTTLCSSLAFLPEAVGWYRKWSGRRSFDIDLVYCWCNGSAFKGLEACRYKNNGELFYSLRSVSQYAPWFRTIWVFVNDGTEIPDWLSGHPKVKIVYHSEVIPKVYLPLYNSVAIEFWLAQIPGLAEHFVYANDDMFLNRRMEPGQFFTRDGKTVCRYMHDLSIVGGNYGAWLRLNRAFLHGLPAEELDAEWIKAVSREPHHNLDGYCKSVIEDFCRRFPQVREQASRARFRTPDHCEREVFSLWAMATGRGVFRLNGRFRFLAALNRLLPGAFPSRWESLFLSLRDLPKIDWMMNVYRPYMFCLNDGEGETDRNRAEAAAWLARRFGETKAGEH